MGRLKNANRALKFDKRLMRYNMENDMLSEQEYQDFLNGLEDIADKSKPMEISNADDRFSDQEIFGGGGASPTSAATQPQQPEAANPFGGNVPPQTPPPAQQQPSINNPFGTAGNPYANEAPSNTGFGGGGDSNGDGNNNSF